MSWKAEILTAKNTHFESANLKFSAFQLIVWKRKHGSATAWLTTILKECPRLGTFLKNTTDWVDSYARKRLNAKSIKLKYLMTKSERAIVFERETSVV